MWDVRITKKEFANNQLHVVLSFRRTGFAFTKEYVFDSDPGSTYLTTMAQSVVDQLNSLSTYAATINIGDIITVI